MHIQQLACVRSFILQQAMNHCVCNYHVCNHHVKFFTWVLTVLRTSHLLPCRNANWMEMCRWRLNCEQLAHVIGILWGRPQKDTNPPSSTPRGILEQWHVTQDHMIRTFASIQVFYGRCLGGPMVLVICCRYAWANRLLSSGGDFETAHSYLVRTLAPVEKSLWSFRSYIMPSLYPRTQHNAFFWPLTDRPFSEPKNLCVVHAEGLNFSST